VAWALPLQAVMKLVILLMQERLGALEFF